MSLNFGVQRTEPQKFQSAEPAGPEELFYSKLKVKYGLDNTLIFLSIIFGFADAEHQQEALSIKKALSAEQKAAFKTACVEVESFKKEYSNLWNELFDLWQPEHTKRKIEAKQENIAAQQKAAASAQKAAASAKEAEEATRAHEAAKQQSDASGRELKEIREKLAQTRQNIRDLGELGARMKEVEDAKAAIINGLAKNMSRDPNFGSSPSTASTSSTTRTSVAPNRPPAAPAAQLPRQSNDVQQISAAKTFVPAANAANARLPAFSPTPPIPSSTPTAPRMRMLTVGGQK